MQEQGDRLGRGEAAPAQYGLGGLLQGGLDAGGDISGFGHGYSVPRMGQAAEAALRRG